MPVCARCKGKAEMMLVKGDEIWCFKCLAGALPWIAKVVSEHIRNCLANKG